MFFFFVMGLQQMEVGNKDDKGSVHPCNVGRTSGFLDATAHAGGLGVKGGFHPRRRLELAGLLSPWWPAAVRFLGLSGF